MFPRGQCPDRDWCCEIVPSLPLGHYLHSISPYQGIVPSGTCTISIICIKWIPLSGITVMYIKWIPWSYNIDWVHNLLFFYFGTACTSCTNMTTARITSNKCHRALILLCGIAVNKDEAVAEDPITIRYNVCVRCVRCHTRILRSAMAAITATYNGGECGEWSCFGAFILSLYVPLGREAASPRSPV